MRNSVGMPNTFQAFIKEIIKVMKGYSLLPYKYFFNRHASFG